MKYYIPILKLAIFSPQQTRMQDKFGGAPWGLPKELWPRCGQCNAKMSFLVQLVHNQIWLDLGREGRSLLVFQCSNSSNNCETWSPISGANSCFVTEPEEVESGLSEFPGKNSHGIELFVDRWMERDELLYEHSQDSSMKVEKFIHTTDFQKQSICSDTKLGGFPFWIQGPEDGIKGWSFVGQLSSIYKFTSEVPDPNSIGCPVGRFKNGRILYEEPKEKLPGAPEWVTELNNQESEYTWCMPGPNFGDAGIGYIFLKDLKERPKGLFAWQCS